jgi:hypothetical protein
MVILVYLSLASSGGTIPVQALPGFFKGVGQIEPLRQLLGGARDVLYFGSQWNAGASHAVVVLGVELLFWIIVGIGFTTWYDRRNLYRLSPEIIDCAVPSPSGPTPERWPCPHRRARRDGSHIERVLAES